MSGLGYIFEDIETGSLFLKSIRRSGYYKIRRILLRRKTNRPSETKIN